MKEFKTALKKFLPYNDLMKSILVLLALLLPLPSYSSEKDTIIRDIKIICEDDDPATDHIRADGEHRLFMMRSAIARSGDFTKGDKAHYRDRIDGCLYSRVQAKVRSTGKVDTETMQEEQDGTDKGPHAVQGQKISGRCNFSLILVSEDDWTAIKDSPSRYSKYMMDFSRLSGLGCFASPSPDVIEGQ